MGRRENQQVLAQRASSRRERTAGAPLFVLTQVGKFLDIFRKGSDGEWRLARIAFSADHD